jgi:hypothetical protein
MAAKAPEKVSNDIRLVALTFKADDDPKALNELHQFLKENPDIDKDWHMCANAVRRALLMAMTPNAPGRRAMYDREYRRIRERLGWEDAGELERMMIEHILLCWFRFLYAELLVSTNSGKLDVDAANKLDQQVTRAHNRYIRACESLSRMRLLRQVEREATARADLWDSRAAHSRLQKPQSALKLLKAAGQGD